MTKDELKAHIGRRIVMLRKEKGWIQSDLAKACYKDRQAIEKIENGKVNPTLFSLYEIAVALKTQVNNLIEI